MRIKGEELSQYKTTEDQLLIRLSRKEETITPTVPFMMSNSTDKEVKKGIIVCIDDNHADWKGKECIVPIDGTISLDTFIEIDDADKYEYRLVKIKNVFLVKE